MADSSAKSTNKKKKRKLISFQEKPETPKKHRCDGQDKQMEVEGGESSKQKELDHPIDAGFPWRNLQLILSLQSKEIDLQKKVELAFNFVNSRAKEEEEDHETVKISRLVVFLSDWVQSLLISTDKKIRLESGLLEGCLDYRCWMVFKFCLEESLRLRVSLSLSRNLLRAFCCIARNALSLLRETSLNSKDLAFTGEGFKLYGVVLDCVSLVLLSHSGLSNENLDLWISTVSAVLELVRKIYDEKLECGDAGTFTLRFSCLVLESFAKFLRVHPTRKNGFRDFVDELVEPLLYLLGVLQLHSDRISPAWTGNLLNVVQEILSQGLFHSVHIEGYLSLRGTEKYSPSNDGKIKDSKTVIKSYHRHFFDKLEYIVSSKKFELSGLGELFHLLVNRVRKQRTGPLSEKTEGSKHLSGNSSKVLNQSISSENKYGSSNLTAEKRKSLLDFFVQIMEPLFLEMNGFCQSKLEVGPLLLDAHCTLKSINHLLASLFHEKLYIKTEDISEGAFLNFLKKVYDIIFSFSSYLLSLPTHDTDVKMQEMISLLAKEQLVAMQYFLDIEYDILQNDLSSLWLMVLSYLAHGHSLKDAPNQCLLTSQALGFGCRLVKLYSELRQVESVIFALCKAIRHVIAHENNGFCKQACGSFGSFTNSLSFEACAKSVGILSCEHEFKLAISNGIKSLPEGQASECVRQLSLDLLESMEWMKSCSLADRMELKESNTKSNLIDFHNVQTELLGRGLSEIYALVLDSLTVTVGNSSLLGGSIRDLIAVVHPYMSILAGPQSQSVNKFLSFITGNTSDNENGGKKHNVLNFGACPNWIFVFFFRLYLSCRSLYRQAITLMPPEKSKKMSAEMWDSFTTYCARDLIERTEWVNEDYFSWVAQPSASLLAVIQSVSDICLQGSNVGYYPLIYVLHVMALQRLGDLNRQIKSLEYMLQRIDGVIQAKSLDDASISFYCKRSRKWGRHLSVLKNEAEGLTEFIMRHLSLLGADEISVCTDDSTCLASSVQDVDESHKWDLCVCSVNKDSLPAAIWWIVCQNVDVWSLHASKKNLKLFLSHVICTCLPIISRGSAKGESYQIDEAGFLNKITVHQISSELLSNSILYEHNFVHRHLASRFCRLLKKSVVPIFSNFLIGNIDLNSSSDWQEILSTTRSVPMGVSGNKPFIYDRPSEKKPICSPSLKMSTDIPLESARMKFTSCQSLLSLLCWMPKGYMKSKSFTLYVTHLLNLERCAISSLLECRDALSLHNQYELLRLLVSCRRTLKEIIMGFCEEKTRIGKSSLIPVLSEDLFSVLWLFKSVFVVVGLQEMLSEDCADQARGTICSLMDHTSYMFLTLSKYYCNNAHKHSPLDESNLHLDSFENNKAWKRILLIAEILKERTQDLLISLKDAFINGKEGNDVNIVNLDKLSSIVSCLSGFLWGLASALSHTNAIDTDKRKLFSLIFKPGSKIGFCVNVFAELISFVMRMLFPEDDHEPGSSFDVQNDSRCLLGSEEFLNKGFPWTEMLVSAQNQKSTAENNCSTSSNIEDHGWNTNKQKFTMQSEDTFSVATILSKLDNFECKLLNNSLLQSLLKGDHPKAAILIRQLLIASSALLRLNSQTNCTTSLSSLVPSFIGICHTLLIRLADASEVPQPFSLVWLDGVLKYLQELWYHFPLKTDSKFTTNVYSSLMEMHLNALGRCISLQGKEAALSPYETDSVSNKRSTEGSLSHMLVFLEEFKARLRMSIKALLSNSSEFHMLSTIHAIKRALVGVHDGFTIIYDINTGSADGGKVSSIVAAGIDCLDQVLEYVSGGKHLRIVSKNIQGLMAALFNIILHLRSPLVYYSITTGAIHNGPDPGAVILMSVEVLTRISGKHALFQMDHWHVAESLRIPEALFHDFCHPGVSETFLLAHNRDIDAVAGKHSHVLDQQFLTTLYAACCRLLSTALRHHRSESEECVSLLQESVRVLLHCLETVNGDLTSRKRYFSLGVQDEVRCACSLRRIYEELRQQKEEFGQHCFKFLSDYILVYSGYGPLRTSVRREVDEALRPGVYALIESCSADDLQHLHSVLGEGPCRNTLAVLQHDYKMKFQYEGKV